MMDLNQLLTTAIEASLKAGERILQIYEHEDFEVDFKEDSSPLTKADLASHNIISRALTETRIPVLSEEGKHLDYEIRKSWDRLWIVDPIDGTKEFIKKNGEFTVNIALIENQTPIAGVIFIPVTQELYFASKDTGSYKVESVNALNSIEEIRNKAIKLPYEQTDRPYTIVASRSHLSDETKSYIEKLNSEHGEVEIISKGSSLKLCMIAEGSADCYPRFAPTMEWDTAAGHAICKYAGFEVYDWETNAPMLYNRPKLLNNWFLVK